MNKINSVQNYINIFEDNKKIVVSIWIDQQDVTQILEKYSIQKNYFADEFAIKIIDYLIGVLKGINSSKTCPIMHILIDYLVDLDLRVDEIFTICTNAKKITSDIVAQHTPNALETIDNIYELFDKNFIGVLQYYDSVKKSKYDKNKEQISIIKNRLNDTLNELKQKTNQIDNSAKENIMAQMIKMVAHQWRQPLSVITLAISTLDMKSQFSEISNQDIQEVNNKIKARTTELSNIIENFLELFSSDVIKVKSSLKEIIDKVLLSLNNEIKNNNINIEIKVDDKLEFNTDIAKISQALNNIIINSIEALQNCSDNKTIKIIAGGDDDMIFIKIIDNGGGIDNDIKDKIYEPYFSTKSKNGRGLGLYLTKNAIQNQFGGELYFDNNSDGVEFVMELPID